MMQGSELTPALIRLAYSEGLFPMTMEDGEVGWFQPIQRALFPIEGIHVSRSLRKTIDRGVFEIKFDTSFEDVMRSCLRPNDNWISDEFIRVYTEIHHEGWGHCAECWHDRKLVGGVYGIALGGCFCAESMFHRETDASKVALWAMVNKCRETGFTLFDVQIMNPHLKSLGAFEVPHRKYMRLLHDAMTVRTAWNPAYLAAGNPTGSSDD